MTKHPKNLGQQISDRLYNQIIQGTYGPGERLPNEIELASLFNVSRTTIREAIRSLTAQGILTVKRGSGTFVVPDVDKYSRTPFKDLEHIKMRLKDLLEFRLIIEPECAYLTCLRATDEEIEYILEQGKIISHAIDRDLDSWIGVNHEFHRAIAEYSHNDLMEQFLPILTQSINDIAQEMPQISELEKNTIIDHALIMEFIKHRNATGARDAMRIHMLHMIDTLHLDVMK